ncbi:UDP-N-acetylmuramoyl-tripeptide--D-alanyl-D-alanine ligase [Candidatus Saccharibacteria bacterium]|nr:UDP-N-acetylmuramoyl-tripeptide--D-alanyl-D-alanine ligase [Candidatus Saccharibacteria bacterium]
MLNFGYERVLLYMLQQTEYDVGEYFRWLRRVKDFRIVTKRQQLVPTRKVKLLFLALAFFVILYIGAVFWLVLTINTIWIYLVGFVLVMLLPIVAQYEIVLPLVFGKYLIQKPMEKKILDQMEKKLREHPATKIAIVGSYGKTTAKEILSTVLGAGKKTAATPGNINQPLGIAKFVDRLDGDEDILIIEMGEYRPGDIAKMCQLVGPDIGFITGVSEAHLVNFGTLENIVATLFELREYLDKKPLYLNGDNEILRKKDDASSILYSCEGLEKHPVKNIEIEPLQTKFTFDGQKITSGLIGRHNIGIVAAAISLAKKFGIAEREIAVGLKNLKPFDHRMSPWILNGAVIIDDTYNGNLRGVMAGVELARELDGFKRKIYITPGLVEQGDQTAEIHVEIGRALADIFDHIVLMCNSVTEHILAGLEKNKFRGEITIIDDPLNFYQNLGAFVAAGDLVLMQNDWTDNYF